MTGYTKLFSSITDSTVWREPDRTRLVWITMLAMADATGYVGASVPGLADRARVPLSDCLIALESFRSPDEWSRTKDFEGRRIVDVDGGWQLLNHEKYRAVQDAEHRREHSRLAMQRLRATRRAMLTVSDVNVVSAGEHRLTQAEAEAEALKAPSELPASSLRSEPPPALNGENLKAIKARAIVPLAVNWELPEEWGVDAESLGWQRKEVLIEAEKFRQYWSAGKGSGGRKSIRGWRQAWSNWLGKAAERKIR